MNVCILFKKTSCLCVLNEYMYVYENSIMQSTVPQCKIRVCDYVSTESCVCVCTDVRKYSLCVTERHKMT